MILRSVSKNYTDFEVSSKTKQYQDAEPGSKLVRKILSSIKASTSSAPSPGSPLHPTEENPDTGMRLDS